MAHFAKLDESNKVLAVHVVNNDVLLVDGVESEEAGINFLSDLHNHNMWKQTSYNASFRKNYAGIDYIYSEELDAFIPPKVFNSWVLDTILAQWKAPVDMPDDDKIYYWNEESISWVERSGD
jgi:hypothetical protein